MRGAIARPLMMRRAMVPRSSSQRKTCHTPSHALDSAIDRPFEALKAHCSSFTLSSGSSGCMKTTAVYSKATPTAVKRPSKASML